MPRDSDKICRIFGDSIAFETLYFDKNERMKYSFIQI